MDEKEHDEAEINLDDELIDFAEKMPAAEQWDGCGGYEAWYSYRDRSEFVKEIRAELKCFRDTIEAFYKLVDEGKDE